MSDLNTTDTTPLWPAAEDFRTVLAIAIIAGVGGVVVLVLLVILFVMLRRCIYRHGGTYLTNEAKGTRFAESGETAMFSHPSLQDSIDEAKKEYFI